MVCLKRLGLIALDIPAKDLSTAAHLVTVICSFAVLRYQSMPGRCIFALFTYIYLKNTIVPLREILHSGSHTLLLRAERKIFVPILRYDAQQKFFGRTLVHTRPPANSFHMSSMVICALYICRSNLERASGDPFIVPVSLQTTISMCIGLSVACDPME